MICLKIRIIQEDGTGTYENNDVVAFASLWLKPNTVEDPNPADLNLDGITNLLDWSIFNGANPAMASAILATIAGQTVPEPSSIAMGLLALVSLLHIDRRKAT